MNLGNNKAGHEPTVSQQFEHVTCARRVMSSTPHWDSMWY